MHIQLVKHDCEDMDAVEICWECGGNISKENLIWYPDPDIDGAYVPGHAGCVDEDLHVSDEEHTEILEKSLAPMLESLEEEGGEDAYVGYDFEGSPIGG